MMNFTARPCEAEDIIWYQIVETPINQEETGYQFTYGVAVIQKGWEIFRIEDITVDREALEKLILQCNEMKVSYFHICDVVEDFLLR